MIPPTLGDRLKDVLDVVIEELEAQNDYDLYPEDRSFLERTMYNDIILSIDKFIKGGKEHNLDGDNPFLSSVLHLHQQQQENHDSKFYIAAAIECSRAKKQ